MIQFTEMTDVYQYF